MKNDIAKVIDLTEQRFKALKPSVSYEAEKGFAMQILYNNDYLMKVAKGHNASLAQAITNVAAIGLSLNPASKEAYLLPRTVKENGKYISKVFLEPSYMGLCKLATNSGSISWIQAVDVYANDDFMDNGPGEKPTHKYNAFSKDRGEFVGIYCLAKLSSGDYLTTLMTADEINDIRERSESVKAFRSNRAKTGGPWFTDYIQQAKKTCVRQAFKMWPKTDLRQLEEAVHISNDNEGFEPLVSSPDIGEITGDQKNYFDQLIEKNDALGMYVFYQSFDTCDATSKGASIWISLTHSFERGSKGKYQAIVNELIKKGQINFEEYLSEIERNIEDVDAVQQLVSELDNETIKLIQSKISSECIYEFKRAIG